LVRSKNYKKPRAGFFRRGSPFERLLPEANGLIW
jgi:hypothetical protein